VRVPHVGARVVSLSHAELIELYEIRESSKAWPAAWPPSA
jgi:DNA-binding GntR family transcriptional regulator